MAGDNNLVTLGHFDASAVLDSAGQVVAPADKTPVTLDAAAAVFGIMVLVINGVTSADLVASDVKPVVLDSIVPVTCSIVVFRLNVLEVEVDPVLLDTVGATVFPCNVILV